MARTIATNDNKLDAKALARLFKSVSLGGLIEECLVTVKAGVAKVQAVDLSNAVFLVGAEKVGMADTQAGITKLSTVQKFLDSGGDFAVTFADTKMIVKRKSPPSELRVTLLAANQVPTAVQEEGNDDEMMNQMEVSADLTKEAVDNILYHLGLVDTPSLKLTAGKDGTIHAASAAGADQEFDVLAGQADDKVAAEISTEVYTRYLVPVLKVLSFDGDKKPRLHFGGKAPAVITVGDDYLWALIPIME